VVEFKAPISGRFLAPLDTIDGAYAESDPAYLSFSVGSGHNRSDFALWHFDGVQWSDLDAADLTYDGQYASFTVHGFSGYAVSAVPEPSSLVLLVMAALALLMQFRRTLKA